ncbi:MAG: sigma-70 family RNA polymerase sigma factor [Lachnospiraceae bacterium]|nr:sigma-70 family RNA polymerase sigma factor [Lachnospiraceae bacterium]
MGQIDYDEIYSRYHDKVFYYIKGRVGVTEDAEDICSDVFTKIYENRDRYDEGLAGVSTWIYRIAHNAVIDHYRTQRASEELSEEIQSIDDIEEGFLNRETLQELGDALKKLSEKDRAIIVYRYYDGLSLKDVAEKLGISYSGCKLRHTNALAQLRKILEKR